MLIEGNNIRSNDLWKKVNKKFQSDHGEAISTHDLEAGFFLSCLISIIPARYNLKALSREKKIFFDEEIL